MRSQRVTGLILVVGALAMIVGVAAHPQHGHTASNGDAIWQNTVVTAIVLASYVVLGVGFLRLARSVSPALWNDVACIVLALAGVCGSLAAIAGHLVVPRLLSQMSVTEQADQAMIDVAVTNDAILSAALVKTSFAAWAIGVLCLSTPMLRRNFGWKILGAYGVVLGLGILLALTAGRLQITLHDIGLVVLGSGIWLIALGAGLCTISPFAELRQTPSPS